MFSLRKLIAFLCVVAVMMAAIAPTAPGLFWAILVTLLFFVSDLFLVPIGLEDQSNNGPASPFLSLVTSRAPPNA